MDVAECQLGHVETEVVTLQHKRCLHLSSERDICTLILCHQSEEALNELKVS